MHPHSQTDAANVGVIAMAAGAEELTGCPPADEFQPRLLQLLEQLNGCDEPPAGLAELDALSRSALGPLLDEAVITRHPQVLLRCLHVGVPMWLLRAEGTDEPARERLVRDWQTRAATALTEPTDVLLATHRARAANLLTDVTRGVAALALRPGGVAFGGIVFCADHAPGGITIDDSTNGCPGCPGANP